MKIPNNVGQIRQVNKGDIFGELTETFNIDLNTNPGKIKVSDRLEAVLTSSDIQTPVGISKFLIWGNDYYAITEDDMFECSILNDPTVNTNWSSIAPAVNFNVETDAVIFDGQMRISTDTDISRWNGGGSYATDWWTSDISGTALTAGSPHMLHVHRGGQETLFVTDANKIRYYNSTAGHSTITLQTDLTACCVDSGVNAIWVGTYTETSEYAYVYEVYIGEEVGGTPVARAAYRVDGRAVLALRVIDNVPHIITDRGYVQAFNGAGFSTVAEFPFANLSRPLDGVRPGQVQDSSFARPIHPNGVQVHNGSLFILLNSDSEEDNYAVDTKTHSGIWEYRPDTNVLHHRFAFVDDATDYGFSTLNASGALLVVDNQYTFILAGANTDRTGSGGRMYATVSGTNQAWFVTTEENSDSVQDAYTLYHKAKTLTSGESIVTQYRTTKRDTVYATATWTSGTEFNTTADFSAVSVGELIRVSDGYAAGQYANITAIDDTSDTVTIVTVDRSIGLAGQSSNVYSDNFLKIDDTYTSEDGEFKKIGLDVVNPWIQLMVILTGDIEYRMLDLKSVPKNER